MAALPSLPRFVKWKYGPSCSGSISRYRLDAPRGSLSIRAEQNSLSNVALDLADRTAVDLVELTESLGHRGTFLPRRHVRQLDVTRTSMSASVYSVVSHGDRDHHARLSRESWKPPGRRAIVDDDRRKRAKGRSAVAAASSLGGVDDNVALLALEIVDQ
jgi:hypothetical protein